MIVYGKQIHVEVYSNKIQLRVEKSEIIYMRMERKRKREGKDEWMDKKSVQETWMK